MIVYLIVGLVKRMLYKNIQYSPKPYEPFGGDINVKVNLSNYATKSILKNTTGVDILKVPKNVDLASLKSNVDKLDIDKLKMYQLI